MAVLSIGQTTASDIANKEPVVLGTGNLKIHSNSEEISVRIPELKIDVAIEKEEFWVREIPIGKYCVSFMHKEKEIKDSIVITNEKTTFLTLDMENELVYSLIDNEEIANHGIVSGRKLLRFFNPKQSFLEEGIVVVLIYVTNDGSVVRATPILKGSTTQNYRLQEIAKEAALKCMFNRIESEKVFQTGTITYYFENGKKWPC